MMRISYTILALLLLTQCGCILYTMMYYYGGYFSPREASHETFTGKFRNNILALDHSETAGTHLCSSEDRLRLIDRICNKDSGMLTPDNPGTYWRLMVNDKFKVIYCVVPKAGCSSMKAMMGKASGNFTPENYTGSVEYLHGPHFMNKVGLKWAKTLSNEEIKWRLQNYTKFMIVRHPFERIYSAWKDKFVENFNVYGKRYRGIIAKEYPDTMVSRGAQEQGIPNFYQFLRLLQVSSFSKDIHWRSQIGLCNPCSIQYDIVAKMETLDDDKIQLLNLFGMTELPIMNMAKKAAKDKSRGNATKDELAQTLDQLSKKDYQLLYALYKDDFEAFGYDWNLQNGTAVCKNPEISSQCC